MDTYNDLPLIYMNVTEFDTRMESNSFVDDPATEEKWFTYSAKEKEKNKFTFSSDTEKRLITAPIMVADKPIYRYHEEFGEYYTMFTAPQIELMRNKYAKEGRFNKINENHNGEKVIDGVYMVEQYLLTDKVESKLYPDMSQGSWLGTYWVEDEKYWNDKIKNGTFTGFSLEGVFNLSLEQLYAAQIHSLLSSDKFTAKYKYNEIEKIIKKSEKLWTKS